MKYIALKELEKHIIHDGCDEGCGYIDERDLATIPTVDIDEIRTEMDGTGECKMTVKEKLKTLLETRELGILTDIPTVEYLKGDCDNAISRNDMLDAIGHGTTYTSEELQKIINGLPESKAMGTQASMLISTIKSELDNLDTYTIHMGAAQQDKICVEFKEVAKLLEKYRKGGRNES